MACQMDDEPRVLPVENREYGNRLICKAFLCAAGTDCTVDEIATGQERIHRCSDDQLILLRFARAILADDEQPAPSAFALRELSPRALDVVVSYLVANSLGAAVAWARDRMSR